MNRESDMIRVLVVDDERNIREGSERILSRLGFEVLLASRGDDALQTLEDADVHIVLLDLKMPGIEGMDVLPIIRRLKPDIHVIVVTGYATVETAIQAMKEGAYDFISKPFEPDHLRIVVNRAADKIRLGRQAEKLKQERQRTLLDLDTEKSRVRTVVESLPNGVIVTNTKGEVVLTNPALIQLLEIDSDAVSEGRIEDYIPDSELCKLILEISRGRHVDFDDIPDHEFSISGGKKFILAKGQPVLGEKRECLGAVVNMTDITHLRMLDQMKSDFVAKVSHELRSPLSTIHEQLAVVIKEMAGEEKAVGDRRLLSKAREKTKGLISLIGDLLDLSRIEEGAICHEPRPVDIGGLLSGIVNFMESRAAAKQQTLTLNLPPDPIPELTADPLALESIFGNLIANAVNYTQEGGEIRVIVDMAGVNVRVKVVDNGFGIEARYLEKIFERFYRVKNENTRYITGTGLGLPIVKGLVDSLGGFIDVESAPGMGSTFTVLLPVDNP